MKLKIVTRNKEKLRLALQGDVHSGKTLSALLLASGLTNNNWSKIAVIDTESNSASLFSHLGKFNTLQIAAPFTLFKYIEAIELCEESGMEVIILDSITPEWIGEGGIVDTYCSMEGDSATKWIAAMPNHHVFISYLQESKAHIIVTVRRTAKKVLQEEGYAHHFGTVLELDQNHEASVIKDKTGLFKGICPGELSAEVGRRLLAWCDDGEDLVPTNLQQRIDACKSHEQLQKLMVDSQLEDMSLMSAFTQRRLELDGITDVANWQNGNSLNGKVVSLNP